MKEGLQLVLPGQRDAGMYREADMPPGEELELPAFTPSADDVLGLVGDGVISTTGDGRIVLFNKAAEEMFGYAATEVLGEPIGILVPEHFRRRHVAEVQAFSKESEIARRTMGLRREVYGRHRNGEMFPVEATLSRRTIQDRTILTVVVRDVSERVRLQQELDEQRRLVSRELSHRIKNLLAVTRSVVRMSARGARSVDEYQRSVLKRLEALLDAQNILDGSEEVDTTLRGQIETELEPYANADGSNLHLEGPHVVLDRGTAVSLGLVVHELVTNAAKYGALSVESGVVDVRWEPTEDASCSEIVLYWTETNGPAVSPPARTGFGSKLIHGTSALRDVRIDYAPDGLKARLTIKLPHKTSGRLSHGLGGAGGNLPERTGQGAANARSDPP